MWLTAASAVFYMSWRWEFIFLILASTSVDYLVALAAQSRQSDRVRAVARRAERDGQPRHPRLLQVRRVPARLRDRGDALARLVGPGADGEGVPAARHLVLHVRGDQLHRGRVSRQDAGRFATRSTTPCSSCSSRTWWPGRSCGPTTSCRRSHRPKRFDWPRFQAGAQLFLIGLFKKIVIADQVALAVDPVFADPGRSAAGALWLAVLAYAVQIYCDFSGYTDMALGLAHRFGFKLPNNFNAPYLATRLADFWRRWHICLSRWLRDYLYIPLGGNRSGPVRTMVNLFITMLLGGLWHGANWTFVVWGAYHGMLLAIQRLIPSSWDHPALRPLGMVVTFLAVCVGWVFFRAQTFADAGTILHGMFVPTTGYGLAGDGGLLVMTCLAVTLLGQALGQIEGMHGKRSSASRCWWPVRPWRRS